MLRVALVAAAARASGLTVVHRGVEASGQEHIISALVRSLWEMPHASSEELLNRCRCTSAVLVVLSDADPQIWMLRLRMW